MMNLNRREFVLAGTSALLMSRTVRAEETPPRSTMGIVEHSYSIRRPNGRVGAERSLIDDPADFVSFCKDRGAGGVQLDLSKFGDDNLDKLHQALLDSEMYLEASLQLPRNKTQLVRFKQDLLTLRRIDVWTVRTALLSGRRYETFTSAAEFQAFTEQGFKSITLVKPIFEEFRMELAIENHKDWGTHELVNMLERIDSPCVGACVDTGNSLALLEDPRETVEALAPWAFSTHLKDMGVEEYADGFLLSEVPLGQGFLDLPRIVQTLRKARPDIRFNLEMITRDPLKVPCRTAKYWATMETAPARTVARALELIHENAAITPLPRVRNLTLEQKLKVEDDNVRQSLAYAREHLGLSV